MVRTRRFGLLGLLLALLLPTLVALLAFDSWSDYQAVRRQVGEAYDQALLEPVQALDNSITTDAQGAIRVGESFSVYAMFEATRALHKYLGVSYRAAGRTFTLAGPPDLPTPPESPDGVVVFYDAHYHNEPVRIAALQRSTLLPDGTPARILSQAVESVGVREQALTESWRHAVTSSIALIAVTMGLVWLGVTWGLHPLAELRRSLQARPADDLRPLDAGAVPREVRPLVDAVNHHIAGQRALLDDQARFLADASHQLRTPLAIMLTQAGYALRQSDVHTLRESLQAIVAQLTRARRLSDQLLALAHASDEPLAAPARLDLNALAREVVVQHLPLAHERGQDLGWIDARGAGAEDDDDAAPAVPVRANGAELQEALSNLLHNAISYTPAGGRITVGVRCEQGHAVAEVVDSGSGIPVAERPQAFDRFRRGTAAHTGKGAGLGLAIAQAYARRNGAEIELSDGPEGRGLRAVLRLPLDTREATQAIGVSSPSPSSR